MSKPTIQIVNREITSQEYEQMKAGFDLHTVEQGVAVQTADRFTWVAEREGHFIGCASGLAYKHADVHNGWFYLTDLFVEKAYRRQRLGTDLLDKLENEVAAIGVRYSWTWTAGYEAPTFYQKQGYEIFAEMEKWYSDGSSRVALRKPLETTTTKSSTL